MVHGEGYTKAESGVKQWKNADDLGATIKKETMGMFVDRLRNEEVERSNQVDDEVRMEFVNSGYGLSRYVST